MMKKVYTLDCFYDIFGVFLLREDESQQLLISKKYIDDTIKEGDIVEVIKTNELYDITLLQRETENTKAKVSSLLEELRNK